jgi:hypothetical protein
LKTCYFVYGTNGSGTRLVTRIIASSPGVKNDGIPGFKSRMKMGNWRYEAAGNIVLKRDSGLATPVNLLKVGKELRQGGFNIFWVFTIRRPARFELQGQSQKLHDFLRDISPANDRYIIWDNSLLFWDTENYLKEMEKVLGLNFSAFDEQIENPDLKWMKYDLET